MCSKDEICAENPLRSKDPLSIHFLNNNEQDKKKANGRAARSICWIVWELRCWQIPSITTGLDPGVCQSNTKVVIHFYLTYYVLKKKKKTSRPRKTLVNKKEKELSKNSKTGVPGWLSKISLCLQLRSWSRGPGIEPHSWVSAQRGACFSLSLCCSSPSPSAWLCSLSLSVK